MSRVELRFRGEARAAGSWDACRAAAVLLGALKATDVILVTGWSVHIDRMDGVLREPRVGGPEKGQ